MGFSVENAIQPLTQKTSTRSDFLRKAGSNNSLPLTFNKTEVRTCQSQKHLGLILDERLNLTEHINNKIGNVID